MWDPFKPLTYRHVYEPADLINELHCTIVVFSSEINVPKHNWMFSRVLRLSNCSISWGKLIAVNYVHRVIDGQNQKNVHSVIWKLLKSKFFPLRNHRRYLHQLFDYWSAWIVRKTRVKPVVLSSRIQKSLTTMCIYQNSPYN